MTITNTSLVQPFKAIFRDGELYSESDIKVLVTKEGSATTLEYTPLNITYTPNYAIINYTIDEANQFQDGCDYLVRVYTVADKLLYTDKVYVTSVQYNTGEQNISNSDYTFTTDTESDYTIIGSDSSQSDSNDTSNDYDARAYDSDNNGYGSSHSLGGVITDVGFDLFGESTVDHTQYGTFTTADNYTALSVENFNISQPSAIGGSPSFSQYGLADGMNGYIRYRHGYDYTIAEKGSKQYLADRLTNEGVTARSNDDSDFLDTFTETVYLGNDQESISVGDSIYVDANGTKLADGTTNGRANRYWFMHKDSSNKYMICKVTAGIVTHYYEWRTGREGWLRFNHTNRWQSEGLDDVSLIREGKEWVGAFDTGSLVTQNTFAEAVADAQDRLNNNYSVTLSSYLPDSFDVWLDFRTSNGDSVGDYTYRLNRDNYNVGIVTTDNLEVNDLETSYTINGQTVSLLYKIDETEFRYLPLYSEMFASTLSNGRGKGVIVIECKKYTGEIINSSIVYKNN